MARDGLARAWNRLVSAVLTAGWLAAAAAVAAEPAPVPLLETGKPVGWWFAYKFNSGVFPYKAALDGPQACPFGGRPQAGAFSQRFVYASALDPALQDGAGLIGQTTRDPLGATFGQVYGGQYYYVVWNDQFYNDPPIRKPGCDSKQCGGPWGHAKGILAWNEAGEGLVLQVTTPSWPDAGGKDVTSKDGDTLGCVINDDNVGMAQHFFALKLTRDDVKAVLRGLDTANVVTDVANPQVVRKVVGGTPLPADLAALVAALDKPRPSTAKRYLDVTLSSGVRLVAKPSALNVPSWQFLSSVLGGAPLRSATWWAAPRLPTTTANDAVGCWDASLPNRPGAVEIATSGRWGPATLPLTGAPNHAKFGVSLDPARPYAVFADLNQQGQLGPPAPGKPVNCASSQNGRGGMFFVMEHKALVESLTGLLTGLTAPQTLASAPAR